MSGHNPHGRHGQPVNSSQWNHLQVPSYIPRQPQLAHMSNERSIRSPLAWHHTANNPAEALYGYMAAAAAAAAAAQSTNHKTSPLDINPLLPFVRSASNPMPFGSVDLSISSGTRNSMTPSPRSQVSPAVPNAIPSTSTNAGGAHDANGPAQDSLALFAEMSEQLAALKANSALTNNLLARELQPPPANFSMNAERPPSNHDTPMELIKETNCSENDTFSAAAMPLHQLFSANSPNVPQNLNELSKSLLTLINSASTASNAPTGAQSVHNQSTNSDLTKSSASTSNDESVDSQPCNGDEGNTKRTRCRRRKPQKTIRMANDAPTTPPLANGTDADGNTRSHKNSESSFEDTSQTHSMDLSNYSASHDTFSNGKLTNSIYPTTVAKPMNGFASMSMARYSDPINSMPSASNHLKSTFNTDDLVKKVEEIVKCNSNDAPPIPTNFSATRNGDENKDFNGQLSNGGDKNCSNSQPVIAGHTSPERRLNGNENGTDLIASQETDTKGGKALDEVPLMASAEVKLPDITLPMANSTPKHNHVDDVENHLEKMFAHVDSAAASSPNATETTANVEGASQNDSENQNSQTQNDANSESALATKSNVEQGTSSAEPTPSTSQSKPARSRKRPAANSKKKGSSAPKRLNKSNAKGANNGKNAAKNTSKNNKNAKSNRSTEDIKKTKEELAAAEAVAKFRGPYIQVQRDGSECIVNAPITEEVTEKQNKIRKAVVPGVSGARSRVSGLHVSTLSNKYDTITTDASWMCVFCKLGPHKHGLGDLFGPFILSTDSKEFQESQFDPSEDAFRSQRTSSNMVQVKGGMKVVPAKASTSAAATANNAGNSSCRKKRKITESADTPEPTIQVPDIFYGMTKVSETAYEVWVHEDCVVWANGVYLVGATIIGLDAAVWGTSRHKCSICERFGAGIACLKRGCRAEAHVPCASRGQWSLNEAKFQTHCKLHAIAECDTVEKANATARPSENCE